MATPTYSQPIPEDRTVTADATSSSVDPEVTGEADAQGAHEGCNCVSRRSFLTGAAVVTATALVGGVVAGAEPAAAAGKWVSITNLTSLKVNVIRVFDPNNTNIRGLDRPVALTRHARNVVTALDARCTHQGCTVGTKAGKSFVCPCHYSTFSGTGKRLGGAAKTNLRTLKARVYKGKVQVFINPATF